MTMTANDDFPARWYYASHEDSECWWGAKSTREEAIEAGLGEYPDEPFWITAGTPMKYDLHVFDDDLEGVISTFQNRNEDLFGEDGQGDPETEWTNEQCRELATRLNATFADWAREHGFHKAYMLDLAAGEQITPTPTEAPHDPS
jgi:hypothetical protein